MRTDANRMVNIITEVDGLEDRVWLELSRRKEYKEQECRKAARLERVLELETSCRERLRLKCLDDLVLGRGRMVL